MKVAFIFQTRINKTKVIKIKKLTTDNYKQKKINNNSSLTKPEILYGHDYLSTNLKHLDYWIVNRNHYVIKIIIYKVEIPYVSITLVTVSYTSD